MRWLVSLMVTLFALISVMPATAAAKPATYSTDDYVDALTPVVEAEFVEDGFVGMPEDYACMARRWVRGFTVRQLRQVGDPATVANERSKKKFDFARFGVTPEQETRIGTSALWNCFGAARVTAFGLQTRGLTLSDASYACLDEEFAADPGAEDGYIEATVRELLDRPRVLTETLMRAGVILNSCLTEDEKRAL